MVAQGGDGGTVDIGFGCLSGMFERNDDVLYICYDNEGYMNTGVQRSARRRRRRAPPPPPAVGPDPGQRLRPGQGRAADRDGARASRYVATATVADLRDLEAKVERAMELHGARYLHVLVPCPLGWGSAVRQTRSSSPGWRRETGLFPVFEAAHGEVTGVTRSAGQVPVEEYLQPAEALRPPVRQAPAAGDDRPACRRWPTATSRRYGLLRAAGRGRGDGQAVRDHARRRVEPGQQHRLLAHRAAGLRDRLPPCNDACPAGENIQGWLYDAESGDYEAAWRQIVADNPFPAVMGRVCYHPCETACNRAQLDEAVGINAVERFLGDQAIEQGWRCPARRRRPASACSWSARARRASSAAYHLARLGHEVRSARRRPRRAA